MSEHPLILKVDTNATPQEWITYERAAYYYTKDQIAWSLGDQGYTIFGGHSRLTGERSYLYFDPILAIRGEKLAPVHERVSLSKKTLFRRDHFICAYCGGNFREEYYRKAAEDNILQMEHVVPLYLQGPTSWENLVTACRSCNNRKGNRTPEQANMPLLYVPYAPNKAEWLILMNRRILADQMEFLKARVNPNGRGLLHEVLA